MYPEVQSKVSRFFTSSILDGLLVWSLFISMRSKLQIFIMKTTF